MSGSLIASILIGIVLTIVGFMHPIGPALMYASETPFDVIPFALFGVPGNLITYVPLLIFLIRVNPARWGNAFFGTRLQQYIALFVMALLVCHAISVPERGIGEVLEWLRKVTLFIVMSIMAFFMRDDRHLGLMFKTMSASMALFTVFSALDFYGGIQILPVKAGLLEQAAFDTEFKSYMATDWRFTGPGYPVNRFSNYLLPATFLGVGWFMHTRKPLQRLFALGCTVVLVFGQFATVTRSGILGMVLGMLIMLPMALRFRLQQVLGVVIVTFVLGSLIWWGVTLTSADQVLATRFEADTLAHSTGGRIERMIAAVLIWAEHPFFGVGWGFFKQYSPEFVSGGGMGAHNGYLNVLAEAGLLGFIPLMIVLVAVFRRNLTRIGRLSSEHEFWRPYFFCALVAQLTTNIFNDYLWERYLWINFAFAIALEYRYLSALAGQTGQAGASEAPREAPDAPPLTPGLHPS